jgi:topoisomerase-4 subunit B
MSLSVVNAMSDQLWVEVARDRQLYRMSFTRGKITKRLEKLGPTDSRGTTVCFRPDPEIFGSETCFKPSILYAMAQSRALAQSGIEINWKCNIPTDDDKTPNEWTFKPH